VLGVAILVTVLGTPGTRTGELAAFQRAMVFIALSAAVTAVASLLLGRQRRNRQAAAGPQLAAGTGRAEDQGLPKGTSLPGGWRMNARSTTLALMVSTAP
jgi:hypothetical protein